MKADHRLILTLDGVAYLKIGKRTLYGLAAKFLLSKWVVYGDFGEARLISDCRSNASQHEE